MRITRDLRYDWVSNDKCGLDTFYQLHALRLLFRDLIRCGPMRFCYLITSEILTHDLHNIYQHNSLPRVYFDIDVCAGLG